MASRKRTVTPLTVRQVCLLPVLLACSLLLSCQGATSEEHVAEARRILEESKNDFALVRMQERRRAISELKKALQKDGGNLEASILLGKTLYDQGSLEDADRWLEKAMELGADAAEVVPMRAELLLITGELDKLDSLPFDGLTPEGRSIVQAAKAVSMLEQDRPELALETLEAALGNEPHSPFAEVAAARIAMVIEGFDAAHERLEGIVSQFPEYAPAWSLLGDVQSARGQAAAALKAYEKYMELVGIQKHTVLNSALMQVITGRSRRAQVSLNRLQEQYPGVMDYDNFKFARGLAFMDSRDKLYSARKSFLYKVEDVSAYPQAHYYLAALSIELGVGGEEPGYEELALSQVYEFLGYVPESASGARLAAKIEMSRGKYKNAERLLSPVLRRQPEDREALSLMARTLVGLERMPEAIEMLDRLVALQPDSMAARARLGAAYLGAGAEEMAIPAWWELLPEKPDTADLDRAAREKSIEVVETKQPEEQDILGVQDELEQRDGPGDDDLLSQDAPPGSDSIIKSERTGAPGARVTAEQLGLGVLRRILEDYPGYEQADILLVLNHLRQRRIEDAINAARAYRDRNPSGATPYILMGRAYLANNDRRKARAAFTRALELRPEDTEAGNGLAELAMLEGDLDTARQHYDAVLARHAGHTRTWLGLASTYAQEGSEVEMLETLQRAIAANPRALEPRLAVVRYHVAEGDVDQASFLLRGFTEEEEMLPETLEVKALVALADGRYDQALVALQKLVRERPDTAQYHYLLAKTYAGLGNDRRMQEELERAAGLAPGHYYARLADARLKYASGRYGVFNSLLEELQEVAPQDPEVLELEAWSHHLRGNDAAAGRLYEKVYAKQPTSNNLVALAVHRHRIGDTSGAIHLLRNWLDDHPEDLVARERLAEFYSRGGQSVEAEREYREIVKLQPNHASALNNLAWHLLDEDPEGALEYAERALLSANGSSAVYDTLAMAQLRNDKLREARRSIGRARELDPDNPVLQSHEDEIMSAGAD